MTDAVSALLHLQHRAREAASGEELAFVMVNETHVLTPYRQAALWVAGGGVVALSGISTPEFGAPFTLWLGRVCARLGPSMTTAAPVAPELVSAADRAEWSEWLPPYALWLPLAATGGKRLGALLLARDEEWGEGEARMLAEAAHAYGHAWGFFRRPSAWSGWRERMVRRKRLWVGVAAAAAGVAVVPVPLTVLAPAEMVAAHPVVVRSPLDGVVDRILVTPNERVVEGQPLFDLDATQITGKLEVAEKTLATAEAEYRQASQQAVFDPAAKAKIAVLSGRADERAAEATYLRGLLERIHVKAAGPGIAVLDDPSEWIGHPVGVGERVMAIAEERDTEIEGWLAVGDAVELAAGAPVTVFLNADPLNPVRARLRYAGYAAVPRPDATVAYRLRAVLDDGVERPRLGLKGTARIESGRVSLIYWLLRRPLAAVRHFVGM